MLSKKHEPFIDLKHKSEMDTAVPAEGKKKEEPRGPEVYIRNVELPLTEKDLGNVISCEIKAILRRISESKVNGKKECSYDLEIAGIRFKE